MLAYALIDYCQGVRIVQLSWIMRLRIVAALAIGVLLIGVLAWPVVRQQTPFDPLSIAGGTVTAHAIITCGVMAFVAGLIAYFVCWPWGREIGVIAAPAGLAIWAIRSGNMANLMKQNHSIEQQQPLFRALQLEPILWLAVVAAGFAGVFLAAKLRPGRPHAKQPENRNNKDRKYLNAVLAVVVSILIAQFCIGIFTQDRPVGDQKLGMVAAQPATGQIVFGVWISFGIAAFIVRKFLAAGYLWPTIASGIVTAFGIITYMKHDTMAYLVQYWPPVFYSNAIISILPIQMVAFGTLGSIWGYWLAVRFIYWRQQGRQSDTA